MKLKTLFIINAIIILSSGLSFLFAPAYFMSFSGVTLSVAGEYLVRFLGVAYIAISILCWLVKNAEDSTALRAIVASSFMHTAIGSVLAVYVQVTGIVNASGWVTVILYIGLAISYGYFSFKKPLISSYN